MSADEKCVYVGQREVAVSSPDGNIDLIGSEDATTCHVVVLRHVTSGVTGLAHVDSDEPDQLLCLEREVRDRCGSVTTQKCYGII